jgi:hypothetical protein
LGDELFEYSVVEPKVDVAFPETFLSDRRYV